ncbi:HNH endonuclease [Pseudoalteromonas tetraodonis]|uniref:HNH endonuclease n=1 Tax=Pseudoalteromonas tetraodonis TaxID=43659 RepID=UPI003A96BC1C
MRICKLEECDQPIASRETELCHKHHLRLIRYGTTERSREYVDKTKICEREGCERRQQTIKGLCLKHYKEWKRQQPIDESNKCRVCNQPVGSGSKGYCTKHYSQLLRNGDPIKSEQRKFEPYGNLGRRYLKTEDGRWLHKVVAEHALGRELRKGEVVHHVDLDKHNNSESNIYVCESNSHHLQVHRQLECVAGQLVRDGIIVFRDGKYHRNI